jgi:hypothetical protein
MLIEVNIFGDVQTEAMKYDTITRKQYNKTTQYTTLDIIRCKTVSRET